MKIALIVLNTLLFALLGYCLWQGSGSQQMAYSVVAPEQKKSSNVTKSTPHYAFLPPEAAVETLVRMNIFDPDRTPNALGNFRQNRIEMALLGTFRIDDCSGAIIYQRSARNQGWPPGMMGAPPWMMGGPPEMMGPPGGGNRQSRDARRTRFGAEGNGNVQAEAQAVYKQYVRIGETLDNGYKLISIDRSSAVLSRGSDTMTLELLSPSEALTRISRSGERNQNRPQMSPEMQMMQNMQRMQMMQNMQMMRMMQQNTMSNNAGNRNGNANNRNQNTSPGGMMGGPPGMMGGPPGMMGGPPGMMGGGMGGPPGGGRRR